MKINIEKFRIPAGKKVDLDKWPTLVKPFYQSEKDYRDSLGAGLDELTGLQKKLYASNQYSLLVIFQAMDAAGKDSAIKHVMSGVDPQGCQVFSFKKPSDEELKHDFLWRSNCRLPERGRIGIFNRSYYEEVLVVKVHPEYLRPQGIDPDRIDRKALWKGRYESIVDSERHLHRNNTRIVKFFLHVSMEEQRKRLLSRIESPDKNWKFNLEDIKERERWSDYMKAYEACLAETSTDQAPWYAIPADDKRNARLIISKVIVETLDSLKMRYPVADKAKARELQEIRKLLAG
ncbi:MAG: phosphate--nucleotide phosphotransferase [Fibrobacteres bacterium]|nr:phosphate--nucleotide phosphotransferase [Fibrobacterota bacterium]